MRDGLTWQQRWEGPDQGLICCWERGRQLRNEQPELAKRAESGELVTLPWKGGTAKLDQDDGKKRNQKKKGSLNYVAMWQGLRNENLNVSREGVISIKCSATGRSVVFSMQTAAPKPAAQPQLMLPDGPLAGR